MIDYRNFLQLLSAQNSVPADWMASLESQIRAALQPGKNRDILIWEDVLKQLPEVQPSEIILNDDVISSGS